MHDLSPDESTHCSYLFDGSSKHEQQIRDYSISENARSLIDPPHVPMLSFGKGTSNDREDHLFHTSWNRIKTCILVSFLVASTDRSCIRNGITVQAVTVEKVSTQSMYLQAATRPFFFKQQKKQKKHKERD